MMVAAHLLLAAALSLPGDGPLVIEGDGKSGEVRQTLPEPATLVPDACYGFSYMVRSDSPAHCLAGTGFAALGTGEPGDGAWRRRKSVFVVPSRGKAFPCWFHFGQWRPKGRMEVKDVEVVPLKVEHLSSQGVELGGGEMLDGNGYLYSFPFGRDGRNAARPLFRFDCPVNGRLWWFNPKSNVQYRHCVAGRRFLRAKVFVGSSDWSGGGGMVAVEASPDGKKWMPVGEVHPRTAVDAELPAAMFPCDSVHVRLAGGTNGTIQIAHYNLKGTVDGNPLRIAGRTKFLSAESGKVFAETGPSAFADDSYGALVAKGRGAKLWTASTGRKVMRTRPAPARKAQALAVRTAANEAESVQLVVHADADILDVSVTADGDLSCDKTGGRIAASALDVRRIGYVDVRHPTDFAGLPVAMPDKLLPVGGGAVHVAKGENQPFWITVRPPRGTKKGLYRGEVKVCATLNGGVKSRFAVPLVVEVFGFEMPDAMTCETAFGLTAELVAKAHRLAPRSPEHRDVMERYLQAMAANHLSPYHPTFFAGWRVTWNGDKPTFDFSEWDREMERVFGKYHFNTFLIWLPGLGQCSYDSRTEPSFMGFKPDDPRYEKRLGAYLAAVDAHLKEKGWIGMAYSYVYDEPRAEDFDLVRGGMGMLARHAPGIRRMLPALSHETFRDLSDAVNLWCPQMQFLSSPNLAAVRARGDRIWWYVCNNPKAPYACDFIDHAAPELRIWLWQTWKERVGGILIWDAFNWRGQTKHPDQNGEGRFLYPPEECAHGTGPVVADPVPSVRITHLRDGLEDYEYFAMLKRLDPSNALLRVPDSVAASLTEFSVDPAPLESHRFRLAREIERLQR